MCAEYLYLTELFMCVFTDYTSERLKGILLEQLSKQQNKLLNQAGYLTNNLHSAQRSSPKNSVV